MKTYASMTRNYHTHITQSHPRHREDETYNTNSYTTPKNTIKVKQPALSLFLSELIVKLENKFLLV